MIYRVPFSGPRQEPEPVSDLELGIAVLLVGLIILLASIGLPLIT